MRVLLFTDTLADVNGVSRFIRGAADAALATGRDLTVVTSTPRAVPEQANIINVPPRWSRPMPTYPQLTLAWPHRRALVELARQAAPDVIHCSTPGPVGLAGRAIARSTGVPLLGVYHTDFPAFIDAAHADSELTWLTTAVMKWFYRPFATVLTRSAAYARVLTHMGFSCDRLKALRPGIDTAKFHPGLRDDGLWARLDPRSAAARTGGVRTLRVLSTGRVSVEKNLPALELAWRAALARLPRDAAAQLVVVGDGPYLATMRSRCADLAAQGSALFLGFRHGQELSALYASSDLFVFPSTTDTLGQAVIEAQASGLPTIVTNVGGPPEIVRHARTGLVLPPPADDPRAWSAAIADLLADHPRRAAMAVAAAQHGAGMTFAASFEHFWEIHERAANKRPARDMLPA